jgi:hypothetical protein
VFNHLCRLGVLAALALLLGCGKEQESGPKVTGRVLVDGQPGRPVSVYDFDVRFQNTQPLGNLGKRSYAAEVHEDGTFTLHGAIGKGIPVGRYKVIFNGRVVDATGKATNRFIPIYTEAKTPLEVEITDDTKEIAIDLERKTVTAS